MNKWMLEEANRWQSSRLEQFTADMLNKLSREEFKAKAATVETIQNNVPCVIPAPGSSHYITGIKLPEAL